MRRSRTLIQQSYRRGRLAVGRQVLHGAAYQFLSIGLRTAITIGSTAVLARLLLPADFGYVAMATVVTEFAALLGAFGFSNVLIQRSIINRLQLDTIFWASLIIGVILASVVALLSFTAGSLFGDERVGALLRILCLNFVLNSLTAVPWVVISRLMRFSTDFWIQNATVVLRTAAAIAAALEGMGAWSLIVGALVGGLANCVLSFAAVRYRPRLRFHWPTLTNSWRTSGGYLGNSVLYYLNTNLDLLLVGRGLGATALGYYQNARSLTDEIRGRIAMPIQTVLFPAFSATQSDPVRLQAMVMRAAVLLAALVVPIGFGVSANAEALVAVLYGPNWVAMVPVMQLFGLSASIRAATAISSPLFNASDRVALAFRYNIIGTVLLVAGVLLGTQWGVEGVALAVALVSCYSLVAMRVAFRLIGLRARDLSIVLGPPLLASMALWGITAALPVLFVSFGLPYASWTASARLGLQVGVGAGVYGLLMLALAPRVRAELFELRERWRRR